MYEEFDKHIQELIKLMKLHYPHDCELVINSFGATIRSTQSYMSFIEKKDTTPTMDKEEKVNPDLIKRIIKEIYK